MTTAAAWCTVAVAGLVSYRGASQCWRPHLDVYAGSTATTHRAALAAIPTSRSRNRPVGIPAIVRRKLFPRRPWPRVSRPAHRTSVKLRFSTMSDLQPYSFARAMSWLLAARSRPSRQEVTGESRSRGTVVGFPTGLPAESNTPQATWSALRSALAAALRAMAAGLQGAARRRPGTSDVDRAGS
jgi:hypothetical protein